MGALAESDRPGDDPVLPLESVLCPEQPHQRPPRPPDHRGESEALARLARALADSPRTILPTLVETLLDVLRADSAGLSLLAPEDESRLWWSAIAGAWKPHVDGGTPRDFGPCGDVLDRDAPLLFCHPERRYRYLLSARPWAVEMLAIPLHVSGKAVGTLWVMAHDERRRFDAEDLRQMESVGQFAAAACAAVRRDSSDDARRAALNLMEDAVQAREAVEQVNTALRASEERFRDSVRNMDQGFAVARDDVRPGTIGAGSITPACRSRK